MIVAVRDLDAATADLRAPARPRAVVARRASRRWAPRTRCSVWRTRTWSCSRPRARARARARSRRGSRATARAWPAWPSAPTTPRQCTAELRARGLAATDPIAGSGRDARTGAKREWRNVLVPDRRDPRRVDVRDRAPLAARGAAARSARRPGDGRGRGARPRRRADAPIPRRRCASTGRSSACASRSTAASRRAGCACSSSVWAASPSRSRAGWRRRPSPRRTDCGGSRGASPTPIGRARGWPTPASPSSAVRDGNKPGTRVCTVEARHPRRAHAHDRAGVDR